MTDIDPKLCSLNSLENQGKACVVSATVFENGTQRLAPSSLSGLGFRV